MTARPDERHPRRSRERPLLDRLEEIESAGDRRETPALVDALLRRKLPDETAAEVADVLSSLEDTRCMAPLFAAAEDLKVPTYVRALAAQVLSSVPGDDPPRERCVAWTESRDPVLRSLGIQFLDAEDSDRIARATADADVFVRRCAVESLGTLVRTPPTLHALRRALLDEDAVVREIACRVAFFDEPLGVTRELQRALRDESRHVRNAAADALQFFPRVSSMLSLADASEGGDCPSAGEALSQIVARVRFALAAPDPVVRAAVVRWLAPARWIVDDEARREQARRREDARRARRSAGASGSSGAPNEAMSLEAFSDAVGGVPEPVHGLPRAAPGAFGASGGPAKLPPVDVARAGAVLGDPDSPGPSQRELLRGHSWRRCGRRGVEILRRCIRSPDWSIRQLTARPLAAAGAWKDLAELARDREPVVRRAVFQTLTYRRHEVEEAVLDAARDTLADPRFRPVAGEPALTLLNLRGRRGGEIERMILAELARPDDRDGLWFWAVSTAHFRRIRRAIPAMLSIVSTPLVGNVRTHCAALIALRDLGHPRNQIHLEHLSDVDHLDLVCTLAHWLEPRSAVPAGGLRLRHSRR